VKPIVNIDQLKYVPDGPNLPGSSAPVSKKIGAQKLGYNISVCPPGKSTCPFHNHRINEEMIFILEGQGLLRFGKQKFHLRKGDFVACPAGGREVAHQVINTGTTELKYLALSTMIPEEICEYPDSAKVGIFIHKKFRKVFLAQQDVPYAQGETAECLWQNKPSRPLTKRKTK